MQLVYRSMIYVRKDKERNAIDDGSIAEDLSLHITINTNPTYLTNVGELLLKNGYVLLAFSILIARIHQSQLCFEYLLNMFDTAYDIKFHYEEFKFYQQRDPLSWQIPAAPLSK